MEDKEKMCACGCEDCECEDVDTTDVEEVEEDYGEFEPVEFPIYFDTEKGYPINNDEFNRGVKDASYIVGMYATLVGAGVPMAKAFEFASDMYSTDRVLDNNMKVSECQAQASIDSVKKQTVEDKKSNI